MPQESALSSFLFTTVTDRLADGVRSKGPITKILANDIFDLWEKENDYSMWEGDSGDGVAR